MVDLEVAPLVAAGNRACHVARFERRAQRGRDGPARVRDTLDVDALHLEQLDRPARGKPPRSAHRDRSDAGDATRLSRLRAAARQRALRHMHVHDRFGCAGAVRERRERIHRVGLGRLDLTGAMRLRLQHIGAVSDRCEQRRSLVGRQSRVQTQSAVGLEPVPEVPAPPDPLARVLVARRSRRNVPALLAQRGDRLALGHPQEITLGRRIELRRRRDLRGLALREVSGNERFLRRRKLLEAHRHVDRRGCVPKRRAAVLGDPRDDRRRPRRAPRFRFLHAACRERSAGDGQPLDL